MPLSLDITTLLQAFYLATTLAILLVFWVPDLNSRFLAYGARDVKDSKSSKSVKDKSMSEFRKKTTFEDLLNWLATLKVPHSWFIHFYILSTCSSLVWTYQLIEHGGIFDILSRFTSISHYSMTVTQIVVCCLLLALQGLRRLYESFTLTRESSSAMWAGHYVIGLAFYMATGIAIWIEGMPALLSLARSSGNLTGEIEMPSFYESALIASFLVASGMQHTTHRHLASLKKYTLPTHPAFDHIASPHYSAECAIYLSLALLSTPEGCYFNVTMISALIFVVVNLGISANGTREWMEGKFGKEQVQGKWRMLPGMW